MTGKTYAHRFHLDFTVISTSCRCGSNFGVDLWDTPPFRANHDRARYDDVARPIMIGLWAISSFLHLRKAVMSIIKKRPRKYFLFICVVAFLKTKKRVLSYRFIIFAIETKKIEFDLHLQNTTFTFRKIKTSISLFTHIFTKTSLSMIFIFFNALEYIKSDPNLLSFPLKSRQNERHCSNQILYDVRS